MQQLCFGSCDLTLVTEINIFIMLEFIIYNINTISGLVWITTGCVWGLMLYGITFFYANFELSKI